MLIKIKPTQKKSVDEFYWLENNEHNIRICAIHTWRWANGFFNIDDSEVEEFLQGFYQGEVEPEWIAEGNDGVSLYYEVYGGDNEDFNQEIKTLMEDVEFFDIQDTGIELETSKGPLPFLPAEGYEAGVIYGPVEVWRADEDTEEELELLIKPHSDS